MKRHPNPTNWLNITKTDEGMINNKSCTCSGTLNSHMYCTDCLPQLPAVGGEQWEKLQRRSLRTCTRVSWNAPIVIRCCSKLTTSRIPLDVLWTKWIWFTNWQDRLLARPSRKLYKPRPLPPSIDSEGITKRTVATCTVLSQGLANNLKSESRLVLMTKSYLLAVVGSNLPRSCRTYHFFVLRRTSEHQLCSA
jgi:hypothetical protein